MPRKFLFVTTFNQKGLHDYAQRFINSFSKQVDKNIELWAYAERCNPIVPNKDTRIRVLDLERESSKLVEFKKKWKNVPHANGDISNFGKYAQRPDAKKGFKWNAVRFSHKVYSIFRAAEKTDADVLIWIDADTFVHSPVSYKWLDEFIPNDVLCAYLGREPKWPECGWYSINLKHPHASDFLNEFERVYEHPNDDGIFTMKEWHDSYVFYEVLKWHQEKFGTKNFNISSHLPGGEGHPLINSELGQYFDHLKGDRKRFGQSFSNDIKVNQQVDYWKTARPKP